MNGVIPSLLHTFSWRGENLAQGNVCTICPVFRMPSSAMWHHVALVRTDVSKGHIAAIVRLTRINELGTTLVVTSDRSSLLPRFLREPRGVTLQKSAFLIVVVFYTVHAVSKEIRLQVIDVLWGFVPCSTISNRRFGERTFSILSGP
jgi:hypothetical protein